MSCVQNILFVTFNKNIPQNGSLYIFLRPDLFELGIGVLKRLGDYPIPFKGLSLLR